MAHPICVSLLILTKSLQTQLIGTYLQRKEIQALQVQQGRQVRLVPQAEQDPQAHLGLQAEQALRDLQVQQGQQGEQGRQAPQVLPDRQGQRGQPDLTVISVVLLSTTSGTPTLLTLTQAQVM